MYHLDDNIAAIATARGSAARGIVRASGPTIVERIAAAFDLDQPADASPSLSELARPARLAAGLRLPGINALLPGALFVWPTRRSYTGEPLVEWHTLGSPPLVEASLQAICRAGARLAEPGEFTLRAFLAGRIDLTQAEAVLGVIDAGDRASLDAALRQLAGGLAQPFAQLRSDLVALLVDLEAGLDFVEEGLEFVQRHEVLDRLTAAADQVERLAEQMQSRATSTDLPRVVLRGLPNVGKSRLFNALAGRDRALVSPQAGATRDYLQATWKLGPRACLLVDTAGRLAAAQEPLDRAAAEAADRQLAAAELELLCLDSSRPIDAWERTELAKSPARARIVVATKCDLPPHAQTPTGASAGGDVLRVSGLTGEGLPELRQRVAAMLQARGSEAQVVAATASRSRDAVEQASRALDAAIDAAQRGLGEELVAAEIRAALDALGAVVGAVYTDELLDGIFSRFCIGK